MHELGKQSLYQAKNKKSLQKGTVYTIMRMSRSMFPKLDSAIEMDVTESFQCSSLQPCMVLLKLYLLCVI